MKTLNKYEFDMVYIQGGSFLMGNDSSGRPDEIPVHEVTVDPFYMSATQVTQSQWKAIMWKNPSSFKGRDRPVENVSWNDVQKYLKKLNAKTGKHYGLPTEAEWEYAARGGSISKGYKYSGSDDLDAVAWHKYNSDYQSHPVAQKSPNELGLYDMSGNVYEWCWDVYEEGYYGNCPWKNPKGGGLGHGVYHLLRGGSWDSDKDACTVSHRHTGNYAYGFPRDGFRVVSRTG